MFHSRARVLAVLAAIPGVFRVSTALKHLQVDSENIDSHVFLCVRCREKRGREVDTW